MIEPTEVFAAVHLDENEAKSIMQALDAARDAIQVLTVVQLKLNRIRPDTDAMLDSAMDILGPKLGMKKGPVTLKL